MLRVPLVPRGQGMVVNLSWKDDVRTKRTAGLQSATSAAYTFGWMYYCFGEQSTCLWSIYTIDEVGRIDSHIIGTAYICGMINMQMEPAGSD